MNGRNMVLPRRDRVEKWAADRRRAEPVQGGCKMHLNLCCPPVGTSNVCVVLVSHNLQYNTI